MALDCAIFFFFLFQFLLDHFPVVTVALLFDTSPTAAAGYIYNIAYFLFCFVYEMRHRCTTICLFFLAQATRPNFLKLFALQNKRDEQTKSTKN